MVNKEVIQLYQQGIDKTLLVENLKRTTQKRPERFEQFMALCFELRDNAGANRRNGTRKLVAGEPGSKQIERNL